MVDELDEVELEQLEADMKKTNKQLEANMKKANKFFEDSKGRFDRLEGLMEAILQSLDKLDRKMESTGTGSKSGFNVGSSSNAISAVHNRQLGIPMVQSLNYAQPLTKIVPMAFLRSDGGSITDSFSTPVVEDDGESTDLIIELQNTVRVPKSDAFIDLLPPFPLIPADNNMAHTTVVPAAPVSFVADQSFPLLQDPTLCNLKTVEFGFLPPTVSYPSHFISIFRDGHKLDDGHDGVLFLLPYSVPVTAATHFNDIFLCLSLTAKSIEGWTSNQFLAFVIFTILDYRDFAPLRKIISRSTFDPGISFSLALVLKCSVCYFQGLFNESEAFNIAQLWFLTCWTHHLELDLGPTITIFYYVHAGFLQFTRGHCSSYSWDDDYIKAKLFLLLMRMVTTQPLGILLFGDTFAVPSTYMSFSILMIKPHKSPNMFSLLILVFDPGISVRASCLVAGAYYHLPCWDSCFANGPASMKLMNECTATLIVGHYIICISIQCGQEVFDQMTKRDVTFGFENMDACIDTRVVVSTGKLFDGLPTIDMVACTATSNDGSQHTMLIESWHSFMQAVDLVLGAITLDTIFSESLWFHFLLSLQSHARFSSELITWLNATFLEHYTSFISDVLKWGLKRHLDFVDQERLYVGALIIATVMLLFNGMADLSIISGTFLVHYKQQDLLLYSTWAYVIVENAGSTNYVEISIAAAILIVVLASCVLVMLYKLMSFWFAEVLVVLFCIDGIEGLQTCLVAIWNSLDSTTWQFLDYFISSFPNLDLEDKVNFPGGSNVMNLDEMGLTEDNPMGTWVVNEQRSIRRSQRRSWKHKEMHKE